MSQAQRSFHRLDVDVELNIKLGGPFREIGMLEVSLSAGGLGFPLPTDLALGGRFDLSFRVLEGPDHDAFETKAEVARVVPGEETALWGLRFVSLSEQDQDRLSVILFEIQTARARAVA